jgi:DNA-binding transcriptional regulator YiaG
MTNKLATFRIEEDTWNRFQEMAKADGGNASQELIAFINFRLGGGSKLNAEAGINDSVSSEDLNARVSSYLDRNLDHRIDDYLYRNLDKRIESYLDTHLDKRIDNCIDEPSPKTDREIPQASIPQSQIEAKAIEPIVDSSDGLNDKQMAIMLKVDVGTVRRWRKREREPSKVNADLFDCWEVRGDRWYQITTNLGND